MTSPGISHLFAAVHESLHGTFATCRMILRMSASRDGSERRALKVTRLVESRCGAVALGRTYLLPPLSSGGALVVLPWLRFHIPLIDPDRQIWRVGRRNLTAGLS